MSAVYEEEIEDAPAVAVGSAHFGQILARIVQSSSQKEVAKLLGITAGSLSEILTGKRTPTQRLIERKHWGEILAKNFPKDWFQNQAEFEVCVASLTKRAGLKIHVPKNAKSFGFVLFQIVGGEDACIADVARDLNVHPSTLRLIIHGERDITQQYIEEKGWRKTLEEKYADNWRAHEAEFEARALMLSTRSKTKSVTRTSDEDTPGHILLQIAGGEKVNKAQLARRLHISTDSLNMMFYENVLMPLSAIKILPDVLAKYYPQGWNMYGQSLLLALDQALPVGLPDQLSNRFSDWDSSKGPVCAVSTVSFAAPVSPPERQKAGAKPGAAAAMASASPT